ncbi:MAG TPA: hypothetical protein VGH69_08915 [Mycobacterium sp.]
MATEAGLAYASVYWYFDGAGRKWPTA